MRDSFFALRIAGFSAVLAAIGSAQALEGVMPVTANVKDAGVFHAATQTWTRAHTQSALGPDVLYNNSVLTGYFGLVREAQVRTDEGRIPSNSSEGNADVYIINGVQIGYCTAQTNALTATVSVWGAHASCTSPLSSVLSGSTVITGLPTTPTAGTQGCWLVTVDLMGTTDEFTLDGDAEGIFDNSPTIDDFGIGLNLTGHANDGTTGWLICGNPNAAPFGAGTKATWGFAAGPDGTGLGQQDQYWIDDALGGLSDGCYWYGGYPANPWGGYREVLFGDKATSGPTPYCVPGGANSISAGGAVLSSAGGYGTAGATFDLVNVPTQPGIMYSGLNQIQIPFGCGDRCAGGNNVRGVPFTPASTSVSGVAFNMSGPNTNVQYWYRDPMNFTACGSAFNLSNALGL